MPIHVKKTHQILSDGTVITTVNDPISLKNIVSESKKSIKKLFKNDNRKK